MTKNLICILITIFAMCSAPVAMAYAELSQNELQRLIKAKALLKGTEERPVRDIAAELEKTGYPREHLLIYEATAATFRDIQDAYGHNDAKSQQQLLEKIRLNMAYFQLGGSAEESKEMGELNRLIQRKLKEYLPEEIWKNPKLFHSLE